MNKTLSSITLICMTIFMLENRVKADCWDAWLVCTNNKTEEKCYTSIGTHWNGIFCTAPENEAMVKVCNEGSCKNVCGGHCRAIQGH